MTVEMPTDALVHIAPAGYTREHGRVEWKLTDYEPRDDLAITVHPMYLGRAAAGVRADDRASFAAAIAKGEVKKDALRKAAGEMRKETAELVRFASWFHDVAGKKIGLPAPAEADVRACVEQSIALIEDAAK
jgi:hypothetical protein